MVSAVDATVPSVSVGIAVGVSFLIQWVWMGLALGALLKKLDSAPALAWIPVLRWIAAARAGRASTVGVAIARGAAVFGAVVAIAAIVAAVMRGPLRPEDDIFLAAVLSGILLWLAGSLTGWVLWVYGAGTVQMRMRAPRSLTWVAALWPVLWASIMGWGKYSALGARASVGGEASVAAAPISTTPAATATGSAPQVPAGALQQPSVPSFSPPPATNPPIAPGGGPVPTDALAQTAPRKSPFAALAPEVLRPDTTEHSPPIPPSPFAPAAGPAAPANPPGSQAPLVPSPAAPSAEFPADRPHVAPPPGPQFSGSPQPPAPPVPTDTPPDVSPYVSKLSPYLAAADESLPDQLTPYGNPAPPSAPDAAASAPTKASNATSPSVPQGEVSSSQGEPAQHEADQPSEFGSWVQRMREASPAQMQAEPAAPELLPVEPSPVAPSPVEPSPVAPSPVAPSPAAPSPAAPSPPPAPSSDSVTQRDSASAVMPIISDPPSTPTQPTAPPVPVAEGDEEDDESTVVVRRTPPSWTLKVGNASYSLAQTSVVIGRATATTRPGILGIADTTRTMSKRHAELIRRGDTWWVRDLGSTNGTYVRLADGSERRIDGTDSEIVDGDLVFGDLVTEIVKTEA